jgi:hypothetical protein
MQKINCFCLNLDYFCAMAKQTNGIAKSAAQVGAITFGMCGISPTANAWQRTLLMDIVVKLGAQVHTPLQINLNK